MSSAAEAWILLPLDSDDRDHRHDRDRRVREARGTPEVGQTVHVSVRPSLPGIRLAFDARIEARTENKELRWTGHVLAPWIARGDHTFAIEPVDATHVRFVQRERFSGRLAKRLLARETQRGFDAMNHALEARAEQRR